MSAYKMVLLAVLAMCFVTLSYAEEPLDYDKLTITELTNLANSNDMVAQNKLANRYSSGTDVSQDYAEAFKWYRLSANQGYADAQTNLGKMYYNGEGIPVNHLEAMKWFRLASNKPQSEALYYMGVMYNTGEGVAKDDQTSDMYFNLAAEFGHTLSQFVMGLKYCGTKGVNVDYSEAYYWFCLASLDGDKGNIEWRDLIGEKLSINQRNQVKSRVSQWIIERDK